MAWLLKGLPYPAMSDGEAHIILCIGDCISIGRQGTDGISGITLFIKDATVILDDKSISRQHATLSVSPFR